MNSGTVWSFLLVGYLFSVLIETPVLLIGLSPRHSLRRRLFAGFWLTACTYPIVILVMYPLLERRWLYLTVAETFAPAAECALFWLLFGTRAEALRLSMWRDFAVITLANLASFGAGELMNAYRWFGYLP
jgi:hypothetical protein